MPPGGREALGVNGAGPEGRRFTRDSWESATDPWVSGVLSLEGHTGSATREAAEGLRWPSRIPGFAGIAEG